MTIPGGEIKGRAIGDPIAGEEVRTETRKNTSNTAEIPHPTGTGGQPPETEIIDPVVEAEEIPIESNV